MSMGGHQSARSMKEEWLTPPELLAKLGPFDLDPCAPAVRPWAMAAEHYTILEDGLKRPWRGRVWLNPPYNSKAALWLARLADHGDGIALIFARTETSWFFSEVWRKADALLFLEGRLHFHHVDGTRARANSGAPSVLVAYGLEAARVIRDRGIAGQYVALNGEVE